MKQEPTLADELAARKAEFAARADPARVATIEAATTRLRASGIEQRALGPGDRAPALTLPDATGRPVQLASLWRHGPLVVIFYRGGWCPYCNLALRAWQRALPQLGQLGGRLVAVSPQTPDHSLSTAEKHGLAFPVLSDSSLQAAEAFGIAFELPPELVALYRDGGNELPAVNGNGRWALPVPATYVIAADGRIVHAHVESDYRERAEPAQVLAVLRHLPPTAAD